MTEAQTETTPRERIEAWAAKHGVTMEAAFVPFSQSRHRGEKHRSLNWRVTLLAALSTGARRPFVEVDYSAGIGHTPAHKAKNIRGPYSDQRNREELIAFEIEHGKAGAFMTTIYEGRPVPMARAKPILPDLADVLSSLALDASVLDAGGFESWASDYGYDTDSRKAEAIYKVCLETALKMRAALGDAAMQELRDACQDY